MTSVQKTSVKKILLTFKKMESRDVMLRIQDDVDHDGLLVDQICAIAYLRLLRQLCHCS
jgi:hypothetical protein